MPYTSYHNAKLLLTSEYLVLNGAVALAIPLRFGQHMVVDDNEQGFITWQSIANDGSIWFEGKYCLADLSIEGSSNTLIAVNPQRLMKAACELNPDFLKNSKGNHVISTLNYPISWGLGSSSTLIAAVAGWAGIDPFELHFKVSKGSGYDIACALHNGPLLYSVNERMPNIQSVTFLPSFQERIFFVYQGQKQDSAEGVQKYRQQNPEPDKNMVNQATALTHRMLVAATLDEFEQVLTEHETLVSSLIGVPSIRQRMFSDLPGEVKSLGAWGGDFCMITWRDEIDLLPDYLKSKGLETWFNFRDIVL